MRKTTLLLAAGLAAALIFPAGARCQLPQPGWTPNTPGPTVSPYLNLLRPGNSPAINYYGLVRPQFDTLAGFQRVQQRFNQLSAAQTLSEGPPTDTLVTGHQSSFMNYAGYFMTTNVGTRPVGAPAATPWAPARPAARAR